MDGEVSTEYGRYVAHRDDEDAVMRATKRDRRVGQSLAEPWSDDHERRTPRQSATLAKEHGLRRADGIWAEAREDLEAAGERSRPAAKGRSRPLVGEVVDAVRHEPDLAAGRGGETHELGGSGHDELGGLRVGLDPVLLVRRDVDEEDGVEARRRLVELRLQLAESRRRFPVDLLARIAAAVRPDAAEAKRIGHEPAARRGLGERTKRRERAIAHRQRRGVRDDLRRELNGPFGLREPEPVSGAKTKGPDRVRAARRHMDRETHDDALATAHRESAIDPAPRHAGGGIRRFDSLAEEEARVEPRQRHGLAVDDLDRRD